MTSRRASATAVSGFIVGLFRCGGAKRTATRQQFKIEDYLMHESEKEKC